MADDIDTLRDRLAGLCGYTWHKWTGRDIVEGAGNWSGPTRVCLGDHPFEYGDLTALAAAWPDGWVWSRWGDGTWVAQTNPATLEMTAVTDTGDEYADRLRLTVAVLGKGECNG